MNTLTRPPLHTQILRPFSDEQPLHAQFEDGDVRSGISAFGLDQDHAEAIMDRALACWNACAGMDDPAVDIARLRAHELSIHLGARVASVLPDHPDALPTISEIEHYLEDSHYFVVDDPLSPAMVMVEPGVWSMYPDVNAKEFDADEALDLAMLHRADVLRVVRVG